MHGKVFEMKRALLFGFILAAILPLNAQEKTRLMSMGYEAFQYGDFYNASSYYADALALDSADIYCAWQLAESYRSFNAYENAADAYEIVIGLDKEQKYPLALFYLASMEKNNGNYVRACQLLKQFVDTFLYNKSVSDSFIEYARHELEVCEKINDIFDDSANVRITHLGKNINTPYSEFGAFQYNDSLFFFSALRAVNEGAYEGFLPFSYITNIYQSEISASGYTQGEEIAGRINFKNSHNANITFDKRNKRIFFSRCYEDRDNEMRCKLMTADYDKERFGKPEELKNPINIDNANASQPFYVDLGKTEVLYFVSDRQGGYGGNDIWYSIWNGTGFANPINCGSNINTPGNEVTPFYDTVRGGLFFSSDWHPGLGGYDIFFAKGGFNGWEMPKNLGRPFNSSANDIYFSVNPNDSNGYFTSNRPGSLYLKGETCCNDIYAYEYFDEQPTIADTLKNGQQPTDSIQEKARLLLPIVLYFHNDEPDPATTKTVASKHYKQTLDEYNVMKEVYRVEYAKGLKGHKREEAMEDIDSFFIQHVQSGYEKLNRLIDYLIRDLQQGNSVQLLIKGFCSPLHTNEYNINLSKRRISSLKKYLEYANDSVLFPYLNHTAENGAKLMIYEDPVGEEMSNPFVSDNPNDLRNAVYSRSAAFERRIEIVMYVADHDSNLVAFSDMPAIQTDKYITIDTMEQDQKVLFKIEITNSGKSELIIHTVDFDKQFLWIEWDNTPVLPEETTVFNVLVRAGSQLGKWMQTVVVESNVPGKPFQIKLDSYVKAK